MMSLHLHIIDPSAAPPPLFRQREPNPAGALARLPKFGWRRRETFPAAAAEFGATS